MKPPKRSSAEYLALVGQLYKQPGGEDMSEEQTCEECRHWKPCGTEIGRCRAHPPTIILTGTDGERVLNRSIEAATHWPITAHNEGCGEWMRRP